MKGKDKSVVRGAATLGFGTFIAKLLGAIYRIPLTNLLKSDGLGIYQMIFPTYALLLDFAGAGVPNALARIISAEGERAEAVGKRYLKVGVAVLSAVGLACTTAMAIFARPLSSLQGNADAAYAYVALAPSVFFVAVISCFRGYFQGLLDMKPTAVSQIIEQFVKMSAGLALARFALPNVPRAVAGAALAISVSEATAALYLFFVYRRRQGIVEVNRVNGAEFRETAKKLFATALPVTLSGIVLPFSQVADSFLILNIIRRYRDDATSLYGLFSGVAMTVVGLPVSICYGVASAAVPSVAGSNSRDRYKKADLSVVLTMAVSLPCAVGCFVFAPQIVRILYRGLNFSEAAVAAELLRLISPAIVLLSLVQTLNGILIGFGKLYIPLISLLTGVGVKIVTEIMLLSNVRLNIYAAVIALIACYFFVCLLNLIVLIVQRSKSANKAVKLERG